MHKSWNEQKSLEVSILKMNIMCMSVGLVDWKSNRFVWLIAHPGLHLVIHPSVRQFGLGKGAALLGTCCWTVLSLVLCASSARAWLQYQVLQLYLHGVGLVKNIFFSFSQEFKMVHNADRGTYYIPVEEFPQNPFCSSKCNFSKIIFLAGSKVMWSCWLSTCLFICSSPNTYLSNCQICWLVSTAFHKEAEVSNEIAFIYILWKMVAEEWDPN